MHIFNKILYACIVFLMILTIGLTLLFHETNHHLSVLGYQFKTVLSESMEENTSIDISNYEIGSLKRNSLVIIKTFSDNSYHDIKVGDVLTFKYVVGSTQKIITHRVIKIEEKEDGYLITLKGDNVSGESNIQVIDTTEAMTSYNYIIGKVVYSNYFLGLMITIVNNPLGIIFVILIPCLFLLIFEVIRLFQLVRGNRCTKEQEIALLKSRLEELEGRC